MSFASAIGKGFKNFGHAIATGAKYIAIGTSDVAKAAAKVQVLTPELELLAGALGGPLGAKIVDIGANLIGHVAEATKKTGDDAVAVGSTTGFNLVLDAQLINDIKALVPTLEAIVKSGGGIVPAPESK